MVSWLFWKMRSECWGEGVGVGPTKDKVEGTNKET